MSCRMLPSSSGSHENNPEGFYSKFGIRDGHTTPEDLLSGADSVGESAGGFADSSVRVYALNNGGSGREADGNAADGGDGSQRLWGHTAPVYGVDFSHDGKLLFSASGDG